MRRLSLVIWGLLNCLLFQKSQQAIQEVTVPWGSSSEPDDEVNQLKTQPQRVVGYFRLNSTHAGNMFYWYFESRNTSADVPVVLWIHGGPGCSSALAIFYEHGPFRLTDDLELTAADWSWDMNHHMIYVDQPMNTGFSYSEDERDVVYDEKTLSEDMLEFLEEFFQAHSNLQGRQFFLAGVSYAGHMVPNMATALREAIVEHKLTVNISFAGVALGNPWINPSVQYEYYAQFAYDHGLIDAAKKAEIENQGVPMCKTVINNCFQLQSRDYCTRGVNLCGDATVGAVTRMNPGINVYDIRTTCVGSLCYDFSKLIRWINQDEVKQALGVDQSWNGPCSSEAHSALMGDWLYHYDWMLGPLLDDGIPVMIYAGLQDLLCCEPGQYAWVKDLEWTGSEEWNKAERQPLMVNGVEMGEVQHYGLLTYVTVKDAGHEAPMDQPETLWHMYSRFTRNLPVANASGYSVPPSAISQPSLHAALPTGSSVFPINATSNPITIVG